MSFSRKSDCDFFWDQKLIYAICVLKWLVNVIWRTFVGFWRVLVQVIVFYCWRLGYRVSSAFFKVVNEKVWSPLLRIFQVAFYAKLEKGFQRSQIWCFCHRRLRSLLFLSWIMLTTFGIFLICNACECFSKSVDMVAWVLVLSGGGCFFNQWQRAVAELFVVTFCGRLNCWAMGFLELEFVLWEIQGDCFVGHYVLSHCRERAFTGHI